MVKDTFTTQNALFKSYEKYELMSLVSLEYSIGDIEYKQL